MHSLRACLSANLPAIHFLFLNQPLWLSSYDESFSFAGGTARGRLVGTIIFICVPGSIIAFFFYIVLYKIYKVSAAGAQVRGLKATSRTCPS